MVAKISDLISKGTINMKLSPHVSNNPSNPHMQKKKNQTINVYKGNSIEHAYWDLFIT